ncbi:Ribosomal RNA large subunit methyltransferase K/L [Frankliniella fusca]|uniref:Ribosomal RNA large subunit methyltransferase K/L n=1 Tax=Frankliniella fusca TaxID=407009 RepID=A0AAE1HRF6_9NEOP|nr:Ribosomal RNA large subunit methyltransferase K/L [Frankliniella fusca]
MGNVGSSVIWCRLLPSLMFLPLMLSRTISLKSPMGIDNSSTTRALAMDQRSLHEILVLITTVHPFDWTMILASFPTFPEGMRFSVAEKVLGAEDFASLQPKQQLTDAVIDAFVKLMGTDIA